jgi:hypothetical protein
MFSLLKGFLRRKNQGAARTLPKEAGFYKCFYINGSVRKEMPHPYHYFNGEKWMFGAATTLEEAERSLSLGGFKLAAPTPFIWAWEKV